MQELWQNLPPFIVLLIDEPINISNRNEIN